MKRLIQIILINLLITQFVNFALGQQTISGYVYNTDSCAIPGALVKLSFYNNDNIKNRKNLTLNRIATMTNIDGYFKIETKDSTTKFLRVSYIGMKTKHIKITRSPIKIFLEYSDNLPEVIITAKPVIYLYPEKETNINIKLNFKGKLTTTYPEYNKGWNVLAKPNGNLINLADNKQHKYLFWEGINDNNDVYNNINEGFIVQGDSALVFLDSTLTKIGLNQFERNDFIVYWLPQMQKNKYNFVHFLVNSGCDKIAELNINPKPETEIRVYIILKKINKPYKIPLQNIKKKVRKGYTIVEWGGSELTRVINLIE